jgi:hypothetical protein
MTGCSGGDGNRVKFTVGSVTTIYTGYPSDDGPVLHAERSYKLHRRADQFERRAQR